MGAAVVAAAQAYGQYRQGQDSAASLPSGPFDASLGLDQRTYFGVPPSAMQAAIVQPPSFAQPIYGGAPVGGDSSLLLILAAGAFFLLGH